MNNKQLEDKMQKVAELMQDAINSGQFDLVKNAFADAATDYIVRYCQEESFAEKILSPRNIADPKSHPQIQLSMTSDDFYYWEWLETGARAQEVAVRGKEEPYYVDSEKWRVFFAPIQTDPVKKPYEELLVAPRLMDMIRVNNAEQVRRQQDIRFMRHTGYGLLNTGQTITGNWNNDGEISMNKTDIVRLRNAIIRHELVPAKLLMSHLAWEYFYGSDHEDIGPIISDIFFKGMQQSELAGSPIIKTVKTGLVDAAGNSFFDYVDPVTNEQHIRIFAYADEKYLGRMIKIGADQTYAQWDGHIFSFYSRRNLGLGFGDVRGISCLDVVVPSILDGAGAGEATTTA